MSALPSTSSDLGATPTKWPPDHEEVRLIFLKDGTMYVDTLQKYGDLPGTTAWKVCEESSAPIVAALREMKELRNDLQAARADAQRYRWLKSNHLQTGPDSWIRTVDDLEEAIDAAMKP